MDKPKIRFEHGSLQLAQGKFVVTLGFILSDGKTKETSIQYPEQFDTPEEAAAHAYREAIRGRAPPFE